METHSLQGEKQTLCKHYGSTVEADVTTIGSIQLSRPESVDNRWQLQ
jgi:hypothetical protein